MRILVFTTLYPNAEMPAHGVFVENRLRAYLKRHDADLRVVAPVPWFPFRNGTFGRYAAWARVPRRENRFGIAIDHPRYLIPPKASMNFAPAALAHCLRRRIADFAREGWDFDVLDAHYFYPDGVAAADVAAAMGKPLVITARGSDVTQLPEYPLPRKRILRAAMQADRIVTVSAALKQNLAQLGAPENKITILRNGVDLDLFAPADRDAIRKDMSLSGPVIASVGHLIDRKGHDLVIEALKDIPDATLLIAGAGEKRDALKALTKNAGVDDRVRFLGALPHDALPRIYNAADVLVLASSREGWPNVLLEAMACGTPCVATDAGGSREVIASPEAGRIAERRDAKSIAAAVTMLLASKPDRAATRDYAENHSWDDTAFGMEKIFSALTQQSRAAGRVKTTPVTIAAPYTPKLIITVDTEERFDWKEFDDIAYDCCDPKDIDRFQDVCAEQGATPLYFLTYPLLRDKPAAGYFRGLYESGGADCGLHLHQWVTPPETEFTGEYFSYQKNLPAALHGEKLETLADAFETAFGARARSHRAGRYGIAPENYAQLAAIGVTHDFSPSAGFDFSSTGGPNFSAISNRPFTLAGDIWRVHVTPVCGAQAVNRTGYFLPTSKTAPGFAAAARALPLTTAVRLSPEGADLDDLKSLTRRLIADKTPVLTFTLHSTSLTPGANPYAKNEMEVRQMLETSRQFLKWFRQTVNGDIVSLGDLVDLYETAAPAPRP